MEKLISENAKIDYCIELDSPIAKRLGFISDKFVGYLWAENDRIIISAILSIEKGKGNFKRLINTILDRGYNVAVPSPSPEMRVIMDKWQFSRKMEYCPSLEQSVEVYIKKSKEPFLDLFAL